MANEQCVCDGGQHGCDPDGEAEGSCDRRVWQRRDQQHDGCGGQDRREEAHDTLRHHMSGTGGQHSHSCCVHFYGAAGDGLPEEEHAELRAGCVLRAGPGAKAELLPREPALGPLRTRTRKLRGPPRRGHLRPAARPPRTLTAEGWEECAMRGEGPRRARDRSGRAAETARDGAAAEAPCRAHGRGKCKERWADDTGMPKTAG